MVEGAELEPRGVVVVLWDEAAVVERWDVVVVAERWDDVVVVVVE